MGFRISGVKHYLREDEVAIEMCKKLRNWRKRQNLDLKHAAARFGISHSSLSRLERCEGYVLSATYNAVAKVMNWPMYQRGRKISQSVLSKGETPRQTEIEFPTVESDDRSLAESVSKWLNSIDKKLKSRVDILAGFYRKPVTEVIARAITQYVDARQAIFDREAEVAMTRAKQRAEIPL